MSLDELIFRLQRAREILGINAEVQEAPASLLLDDCRNDILDVLIRPGERASKEPTVFILTRD